MTRRGCAQARAVLLVALSAALSGRAAGEPAAATVPAVATPTRAIDERAVRDLQAQAAASKNESERERQSIVSLTHQLEAMRRERDSAERDRHEAWMRARDVAERFNREKALLEAREAELRARARELDAARRQIADLLGEVEKIRKRPPVAPTPLVVRVVRGVLPDSAVEALRRLKQLEDDLDAERARTAKLESELASTKATGPAGPSPEGGPHPTPAATPIRSAGRVDREKAAAAPTGAPTPSAGRAPADEVATLQRELDVERENRATLEKEIERLAAAGNSDEELRAVVKSLQSARAEILVLTTRLNEEQKRRETLEVAIERARKSVGLPAASAEASLDRLLRTITEHRAESDRLARDLASANETVVHLKGRLEAVSGSAQPTTQSPQLLADLRQDNRKLREALSAAEKANDGLRAKADLAERLAQILYARSEP